VAKIPAQGAARHDPPRSDGLTDFIPAELIEELFVAARELKRTVCGNRIVLFAPVHIGNKCTTCWRLSPRDTSGW